MKLKMPQATPSVIAVTWRASVDWPATSIVGALVLLAGLLIASSVLAQANASPRQMAVADERSNRRCSSTAESADPSAACADDVLNDGRRIAPVVIRRNNHQAAKHGSRKPPASAAPLVGNASSTHGSKDAHPQAK